jgi:Tfp pilus assembly protein PilV
MTESLIHSSLLFERESGGLHSRQAAFTGWRLSRSTRGEIQKLWQEMLHSCQSSQGEPSAWNDDEWMSQAARRAGLDYGACAAVCLQKGPLHDIPQLLNGRLCSSQYSRCCAGCQVWDAGRLHVALRANPRGCSGRLPFSHSMLLGCIPVVAVGLRENA